MIGCSGIRGEREKLAEEDHQHRLRGSIQLAGFGRAPAALALSIAAIQAELESS